MLAFDVGGTAIKSAIFDADGSALSLQRTPTPDLGDDPGSALIAEIARLSDDLREQHPSVLPEALGFVVPGIVDADAGVGVYASNLGWHDAPLRALAEERLGLPIAFDHDVRSASWAEHELGGARAYDDVVVLIIGTGIAGAILAGGQPYAAGRLREEFGHSPIDGGSDAALCTCGARGCLDDGVGGGHRTALRGGLWCHAFRGARGHRTRGIGDPAAARIWNDALDALALALRRA